MPELPEVETIRRDLESLIVGKKIVDVRVMDRRVLEGFGPTGGRRRSVRSEDFSRAVVGRTLRAVIRRGKYLVFDLGAGPFVLAHLRMTGRLVFGPPARDARITFSFLGTGSELCFSDTRRFGEMWLAEDWQKDPAIAALGPEPLTTTWDVAGWGRELRRSSAKMQSALLDQKRMAGLGNIYVTEALFCSGIRPTRRANTLRGTDIPSLIDNIRGVLEQGLEHRGDSFRDYRDARGEKGQAQKGLLVYGKCGFPCPLCDSTLRSVKVSGRGTVFCPNCQK